MNTGADVSHAGPGSMAPSVASVVASMDLYGAQYTARMEIQRSRQEIIEKLEDMVFVRHFSKSDDSKTQQLLFFSCSPVSRRSMRRIMWYLSVSYSIEMASPKGNLRSSEGKKWKNLSMVHFFVLQTCRA